MVESAAKVRTPTLATVMQCAFCRFGIITCAALLGCAAAGAQLRPETTQPAEKKPPAKAARIVVETSPGAQVYLDDEFKGQASDAGRLVIGNPTPGTHTLRVTLEGKKDYEEKLSVTVGRDVEVKAALGESGQPAAAASAPRVDAPRGTAAPAPVAIRENPKDGLKYVWIPPGTFMMGCSPGDSECYDDEKPAHQVTITKGFWIGQTAVTVGAFQRFASAAGRQMQLAPAFNPGWAHQNMPIVDVSWNDSQAYCQWSGGRLPTEAEWEYAARADTTEARYGPIDELAWYRGKSGKRTHDVAQKIGNAFHLYDTLGNVREWVNDWYNTNYYQNSSSQDPPGPSDGLIRVQRGGSWDSDLRDVRVSVRKGFGPRVFLDSVGFRCVGEANSP